MERRSVLQGLLGLLVAPKAGLSAAAGEMNQAAGRLFVASFMTMHDPFFADLNAGLQAAVESQGDRYLFLDGLHERSNQEKNTIEVLELKPAALFLVPATDAGSIEKILAVAKSKGVPVILVDTDVTAADGMTLTTVLTDNREAGRIAAAELARVNAKAQVGVLSFSYSQGCVDRVEGFREEAKKWPGMRILESQDGHANREGVRGVIQEFLKRHPEMDAIFAINDVSALEAIDGIAAAGRAGKISVLGVAGSKEGAEAILQGKMLATSAQMPKEIGRVAVAQARKFLAGGTVEKRVLVPVKLVTVANAAEFAK